MRGSTNLLHLTIAALVGAAAAVGATVAVEAGAASTSVTYFACLTSTGSLAHVGTVAPTTCATTSKVVSWNSVGPRGLQGVVGPKGVAGPPGPPGPGSTSTSAPFAQSFGSSMTLALAAGSYLVTWDVSGGITGGCSYSGLASNVTPGYQGRTSAVVTVGAGGGTVVVTCAGNGSGATRMTATPTAIQ
jgi:hypothetical protein